MRLLKLFEEFEKEGIVRKRTPDLQRAQALIKESEKRKKFLEEMSNKIGLSDNNANYFIENSYDILIGLIRAKLISDGFNSSGLGAHEAEVAYMRNLGFNEVDVRLMNNLRFYRNGILYYGKSFDEDYAKRVLEFLRNAYLNLMKLNR